MLKKEKKTRLKCLRLKGSISPQMIFCMSINIIETQTPSLDILRQYESRVQTPAGRTPYEANIDVETHVVRRAKIRKPKHNATKKSASHRAAVPTRGILKYGGGFLSPSQENFTNHTISSAIKADYTIPDVKFKLDELNTSVKKTRKIKNSPAIQKQIKAKSANASTKPFVVRKVIIHPVFLFRNHTSEIEKKFKFEFD